VVSKGISQQNALNQEKRESFFGRKLNSEKSVDDLTVDKM